MNKKSKIGQIWAALAILGLAILACGPKPTVVTPTVQVQPVATAQSQPTPGPNPNNNTTLSISDLMAATVQIFGVHTTGGDIVPFYVGTGSIISSNGLILTNAHVAYPPSVGEADVIPDALVIGITKSEDQPPVYAYRAEVRAIDGYMDLAVIQITATLKGESVDSSSLHLPYVKLGNSDTVHVKDHINILGFPAIGGNTITYTSGNVAGFTSEDQLGDRAWIKMDATISGGNSGGMVADDQGQLIGVPTLLASGAAVSEAADCRLIQDTNGDGVIDNKDTCIPVGGFINAMRPVNLATPLIQAAQSGQTYTSPYAQQTGPSTQLTPQPTPQSPGGEQIGQIAWFTVNSQGKIGDQVSSYPSGTTVLVAGFKFSGFVDGEPWGQTWIVGGETIASTNSTWDKGSEGAYAVSLSNQGDPLPDGTYQLELSAGSGTAPLAQSSVVVGTTPNKPKPSTKGSIQLSGTVTDKGTGDPIAGAFVIILNSGVKYEDWKAAGYPKEDILTYAKSDSNGQYVMPMKLSRNTPYTLVAAAEGYYEVYGDDMVWKDKDPADYTLDISLSK